MSDHAGGQAGVRVRFAPSPTGYFHVGGARTALYNWLWARQNKGAFVLRIEDTDAERSTPEMTEAITRDMRWLGMDWDEGPYFQSQRYGLYKDAVKRLMREGNAYPCFCPKEWLDAEKERAQKESRAYRYDKRCRPDGSPVGEDERRAKIDAGVPWTVRFKTPEGERIPIQDIVFGDISVVSDECDDFIIARSDGTPVYNLSAAVDDIAMRITHVIRGNEHLANTPKQILLYRALGAPLPAFAHLPLILGKDKKKLSKRQGAASLGEFRKMGYLPEAMANYLALLGWSPGDDREIMRRGELTAAFSLERIGQAGAIFDEDKLFWVNSQYISMYSADELWHPVRDELIARNLWEPDFDGERMTWLKEQMDLLKTRARTTLELAANLTPYISDDFPYDDEAVKKRLKSAKPEHAAALRKAFSEAQPFAEAALDPALRAAAESLGVKAGDLIHLARIALTGQMVGPSAFAVIEKIGRAKTAERLKKMEAFLTANGGSAAAP